MQRVVLTASGTDRPGIIDEVSQYILERGGSIEDSRLINLRGQVSMLLLVVASDQDVKRLRDDLTQMSATSHLCTEIHDATAAERDPNVFPHRLIVSGPDQTGVVHRFSHLMRVLNINIEQFEIRGDPTENSGREFAMEMILAVPRQTPLTMLRDYITHLANELHLQFELKPL
jgi:glycine cleavage system transcriptional repressor